MKMVQSVRALLVVAFLLGGWQAASAADRFDEIRARIQHEVANGSVPSLAVAVAQDGEILWEQGFGWANKAKRIPATGLTAYSTASISKPITATGLMTLVRDGKIDLDRPIDDYLGSVKLNARIGDANMATVRRVANHTAGLPVHAHFFYADEPRRRPPMSETIRRYANLVTPPGERFQYSNLGYGLLDDVISRASGLSYAEFMHQRVFAPLGMKQTSVDIGPGLEAYAAVRYDAAGEAVPFYDFDHPGASAVFSSAHDLARFGMFHLKDHLPDQQAILDDAQIEEMHRPTAGRDKDVRAGATPAYSIGFSVDDKNGYRVVSHSGGMIGVATEMLLIPERHIVIVALSNSSNALPFETAQAIASALLPDWVPTPRRHDEAAPPFVAPKQLAGVWKGRLSTYAGEVPMAIDFQPGGSVRVTLGDQPATMIREASYNGGEFTGSFKSVIDTPDTTNYEHVVNLSLNLRGEALNGAATAAATWEGHVTLRGRNALSSWVELKRVPAQ